MPESNIIIITLLHYHYYYSIINKESWSYQTKPKLNRRITGTFPFSFFSSISNTSIYYYSQTMDECYIRCGLTCDQDRVIKGVINKEYCSIRTTFRRKSQNGNSFIRSYMGFFFGIDYSFGLRKSV